MKSKIILLLSILGIGSQLILPSSAAAIDIITPACQGSAANSPVCKDNKNEPSNSNSIYGPNGVLTKTANLIAVVVGIASVIMIIISGFKYITSSGDPSNIKSAKDTLMFAVVGIVITVSARAIVLFVLSRL